MFHVSSFKFQVSKNMIHLTILNLKEKLFEGEVSSITLPGTQGELTILTDHMAIVTTIKSGAIKVLRQAQDKQQYFESKGGGIFEFNNNVATILL